MPKKKNDADVVDLAEVRAEIDSIRREALSFGYSLDADKPIGHLRIAILKIRKERDGKPPCYRRRYLQTAPQCRICDLSADCAKPAKVPAYLSPEDLIAISCDRCKEGTLNVELQDSASGTIRNYGCTTSGCPQTLLDQQRYTPAREKKKPQNHEKKEESAEPEGMRSAGMSTEEVDNAIINVVRDHGVLKTKQAIVALVPAARPRVQKRIDVLRKQKRLKHRKKKGYSVPSE